MRSNLRPVVVVLLAVVAAGCATEPAPSGPVGDYLSQEPPGLARELFAPGVVNTGMFTRDLAMTPDGSEIYFSVMLPDPSMSAIAFTRRIDGRWSPPRVAPFSGRYQDLEPAISPDGTKFLFMSRRPRDGGTAAAGDADLWAMDRVDGGWGPPYNLGSPVNSEGDEYFPSLTRDGTLYFTRKVPDGDEAIYRAELRNGAYARPERLGPEINAGRFRFNAFVSPDEDYLIVPIFGLDDSLGGTDYYVCFRGEDGAWSGPLHLDDRVNSASRHEYSAYVSPDGRYLFFLSSETPFPEGFADPALTWDELQRRHADPGNGNPGMYWIDAAVLDEMRPA
jgi:hypothetical protein